MTYSQYTDRADYGTVWGKSRVGELCKNNKWSWNYWNDHFEHGDSAQMENDERTEPDGSMRSLYGIQPNTLRNGL